MSKLTLPTILVAAVAMLVASQSYGQTGKDEAKDYVIKLDRPVKVGQKYQLSFKGRLAESQTLLAGVEVKDQKAGELVFELSGLQEIQEVNKRGQAVKISFTVDKCEKVEGQTRKAVLDKGTVVIAKVTEGKKVFEPANASAAIPDLAKAILDNTLSVATQEIPSDDELFGTSKRQKIGDSWPVNNELFAKEMAKAFPTLKKENVSGKSKLLGVSKVNGTPCLDIETITTVKNFPTSVPEKVKVQKSERVISYRHSVPEDGVTPDAKYQSTLTFSTILKAANPEGGETTLDIKSEVKVECTQTPVK